MSPAEKAAQESLPLVTIVTPTYNQAEYLGETIESVLAQDYPNIEYIVIDDGSTDQTRDVLKRYDGRIRWESQENMGQAATLNRGWAMGRGRYLGYLSSDDVLLKGAIRELVSFLENNAQVVMVYPDCDLIDPTSKTIKRNVARPFDYDALIVSQQCEVGPGALFRAACFQETGGWMPGIKLAPDREYWMRVGLLGEIAMFPHTLAKYRMHSHSISYRETSADAGDEYLRVLDAYYSRKDVPRHLLKRKDEAYAHARIVLCRLCLRRGDMAGAVTQFSQAVRLYPGIANLPVVAMLFRTAISKPLRRIQWTIRKAIGA
jgi:glycosyltransferase involved in cell wall biosynthesis